MLVVQVRSVLVGVRDGRVTMQMGVPSARSRALRRFVVMIVMAVVVRVTVLDVKALRLVVVPW